VPLHPSKVGVNVQEPHVSGVTDCVWVQLTVIECAGYFEYCFGSKEGFSDGLRWILNLLDVKQVLCRIPGIVDCAIVMGGINVLPRYNG
jgi:hypothetical protein